MPDYILEKILRLALGSDATRLWAAAPVSRRWRRLVCGAVLEASLRCKGCPGAAAGLPTLRRICAAPPKPSPAPSESSPPDGSRAAAAASAPGPLLPRLRHLEVAVEDATPWEVIDLLWALADVEAAYARCDFELALALEFDCDAVVAGVQREAAEALAPLGALRRLASLSLTPESGALTPALAAALAPRLASLSLGAVRNPNPLAAAGALVGLRALSVEFDSPQVNSVWVAPLLALAGGLEELSLAWVTFHARGAALQGVLSVVAQLLRLRRLSLSGLDLLHRDAEGLPAQADLSPLSALTRLTSLRLHGGSASVQREKVLREILRPLASLPRLEVATLSLFARRWHFERDVTLEADVFRRWAADEAFTVKFPLEAS